MRTVLLDDATFEGTFAAPMREAPTDSVPVADVWSYVSAIPAGDFGGAGCRVGVIELVYRSGDGRFDHVLIPTEVRNVQLVVVISSESRAIYGHHLLDLNRKYGLGDPRASSSSPEATAICSAQGVVPDPPHNSSKVGIALATLDRDPLSGMRLPPEGAACGWYIWGGEMSDDDDFFQPMHVSHIHAQCPKVLPYLSLPPGWRFLLGENGYVDVWHDPDLLVATQAEQ